MTTKRKNLFLYLTLACFLGLITIFIVDGYLGVYDTIYVTTGEREQKVEADFWLKSAKWQENAWTTQTSRGQKVSFRYQVDNRGFSDYSTEVNVSLWRSQQKLSDLVSQPILVAPFGREEFTWQIDTDKFKVASEISPEQSFEFSVIITRGELERRIIVHVLSETLSKPPVPVPYPR